MEKETLETSKRFDLSLTYLLDNATPRACRTNTAASMATLPMFAEMEEE